MITYYYLNIIEPMLIFESLSYVVDVLVLISIHELDIASST